MADVTPAAMKQDKPTYVYTTYIKTTAEKVWQALTDGEVTRQYWGGHVNLSDDWQVGSTWRHGMYDDPMADFGGGKIVESDRPRRLVVTWGASPDDDPATMSQVAYDILEDQGIVRLTVTNTNVEPDSGTAETWPKVLAGLKTLLETGESLPPFWVREGDGFKMVRFG